MLHLRHFIIKTILISISRDILLFCVFLYIGFGGKRNQRGPSDTYGGQRYFTKGTQNTELNSL